ALYKAIITGQRDSIPIKVLDNFKRSGAIHLLAISGMHMGLLALISGLLLNYLFRKSSWLLLRWPVWKVAAVLTLLIMGCYATISGLQPPVVRAFIMASMLIVAIVLDRPKSMLNIMALAALLILAYEPTALFSVSFQLSFLAVTAIILLSNQFPELFNPDQARQTLTCQASLWLRTGITVSVVALFATAPMTLYHFRQVSLLGPLTTILTAPLICFWALPLGLTAALFSPWLPDVAAFILNIGSMGLRGADLITTTLAAIPFTSHILPPPALATIAIYYLIAGSLLFFKSSKTMKFAATLTMILIMSIPTSSFSRGKDLKQTRITFLDVGQGSATLVELPGDINILLDGGGSSSPRFNPGEQIIGPFLWHQSIRRLNALVISHGHQDHYNGLEFIIRKFKPAEVWINGSGEESREYLNILRTAAETGAKIRVPDKDTVIATGGAAKLTSISNLHQRQNPDLPTNSRSLVIKLEIDGKKIILPGDIMGDDGQNLIDQGVNLQCDVLLAP
ncbi:MAG: ComEC/Rec2 family competence protein, partial [Desulfobulbaceae bacterium]|nr:ComEC/Rec2 family competence protein [Desulfobulbaceae bacterium]